VATAVVVSRRQPVSAIPTTSEPAPPPSTPNAQANENQDNGHTAPSSSAKSKR